MLLLHYVYLGVPNEALLRRLITLLSTQKDPSRVLEGCGHPEAFLWTLDAKTQEIANGILKQIQQDSVLDLVHKGHPRLHIQVMDSTNFLFINSKVSPRDPILGRTEPKRRCCLAAVQMLYAYFKVLSTDRLRGKKAPGKVTVREYVTAKELLILLILYLFGGVGLDAGCEVADVNHKWGWRALNPNNFYAPNFINQEEGKIVENWGNLSYYGSCLWNFVDECHPGMVLRHGESILCKSTIDNFMIVSPSPFNLVALYALRMFLRSLPDVYFYLEKDDKDLISFDGQGQFAYLSAKYSLNAILHAYCEHALRNPGDGREVLERHTNYRILILDNTVLMSYTQPEDGNDVIRILGGILKRLPPYPRNSDGIIVGGWRALLPEEAVHGVLKRFRLVRRMWERWWTQLMQN